jgi:predicted dinucleotide-binding enzyme
MVLKILKRRNSMDLMAIQTKVGIIGSGKAGRPLGAWIAATDTPVVFTSRDPRHAEEAALSAGHAARAEPLRDLVRGTRLMLLTLPFRDVTNALESVRAELEGKIVVDVTNPVTPDRQELELGHTTSGAEEIARQFPSALVVKAFNATFAEVYEARCTKIRDQKISIFYAGDNAPAKDEVKQLIERLGFDAVDAGPLRSSRCLEPLSLLNIRLGRFLGLGTNIAFSLLRDSPARSTQ